jgi:hypothetical protein
VRVAQHESSVVELVALYTANDSLGNGGTYVRVFHLACSDSPHSNRAIHISSTAMSIHMAACEERNGPTPKVFEARLSAALSSAFRPNNMAGKKTKDPLRVYQGSPCPRRTSCANPWITMTDTKATTTKTRVFVNPLAENANKSIQGRWATPTPIRMQPSINNALLRKRKLLAMFRAIARFLSSSPIRLW